MFNYRVLAVVKRELKEKLLSKGFIISTLLIPVFLFGMLGFQTFMATYEGDDNTVIQVVTESNELGFYLEEEFSKRDFVKDGSYTFNFKVIPAEGFGDYLESQKDDIKSEKVSALVYIPDSALKDKKFKMYSKTSQNRTISRKIDGPINKVFIDRYLSDKSISDEDLSFIRKSVDVEGFKVTKEDEVKKESAGNLVLSMLFAFLLYFSLLFYGGKVLQSVIEEKSNRIVEVVLSSMNARELMTGKIIGNSIIGVIQMAIWLSPVLLLVSTSIFVLPPEIVLDISALHILYLLLIYFMGVLIYYGLFAAVGSMFENAQDAQSGMWPIMLLIIIPFLLSISLVNNPTNPIGEAASLIPFTTIIVMPVRVTIIDVPAWQIALSLIINLLTMAVVFPLAGKIFRVGILRTGKKPSWGEVIKWIRYKY